jgi:NYN domain
MTRPPDKIAIFVDGANLHSTAKMLGFDIDYKRLLGECQNRGSVIRAFFYIAINESQEYSSIRPLIDWLDYNGYTVVTKATKEFIDASGRRKVKGNMMSNSRSTPWSWPGISTGSSCFPVTAIFARWSRPCSAAASTSP